MKWTVLNLEFPDEFARDATLAWIEDVHPLTIPVDDNAVLGEVYLDRETGRRTEAEIAWVGDYAYLDFDDEYGSMLEDTADRWDRAVVATVENRTGTCESATVYHSEDDEPVEVDEIEGLEEREGRDVMYRTAMERQFRFRTHGKTPPVAAASDRNYPSAFAYVPEAEIDPDHDATREMAEATGVDPTEAGLEFQRSDPLLGADDLGGRDPTAGPHGRPPNDVDSGSGDGGLMGFLSRLFG